MVPADQRIRRDTPWLHRFVIGYADHAIVVFAALLLAGWWIARRSGDLNLLVAAMWAPVCGWSTARQARSP